MAPNLRYISSDTAALIKFPFSGGQPRNGVEFGPDALVAAGLPEQLESLGWKVVQDDSIDWDEVNNVARNDVSIDTLKNPRSVSLASEKLAAAVEKHAKAGSLPVTLGGDHSLGIGSMIGVARAHPGAAVIWVDAHSDINTPNTTPSGNLHGCPVAFALGLDGAYMAPFKDWLPNPPVNSPNRLVYIGLRDVDEGERKILKDLNIKVFSMHHVDKYGIGKVVDMALDHINNNTNRRDRPIHLSFDVDAMDPTVAPSTGTPVRGGLTFREGHYICEALYETGALVAMDMVEVNPMLEPKCAEATIAVGCSLVRAGLGESLLC
ncbi:arginase [Malassezia vespertilionis]|uniref:Arginase n=1 Tax=Malassezia vespertilionis TaxID=2020962 RepID=A0A2N1JB32_9BASI|nr:arginase [Malassezia vespertilionis]PKI83754.1 Car1p [Malassezia vespertilionis]WFD07498.1 arginase [Malassezia vespertilionis]